MNARLWPILILFLLTSCRVLQPVKDAAVLHLLEPLVPDRPLTAGHPAVAVKRPTLPGYLDRSQLITRASGQLMMSPLDLWAEPLDTSLAQVIASNLSRLTGSLKIQPVENFTTLDYTQVLELKIAQFDPDPLGSLILQGTWTLQPITGIPASAHFFRITIPGIPPADAAPMAQRVAAMNQALERLAQQIAPGLNSN
jgi:uncharacterized lipoprotein YmbA